MTDDIVDENNVDEVLNGDASKEDHVTEVAQIVDDHSTPAGDPDDVDSDVEDTHPNTDSDIDEHERYDQGL